MRRVFVLVPVAAIVASLGSVAHASDPSEACNPTGRTICVTTSDVDGVSHSTATFARSTVYTVSVRNGGGSTLTNLRVQLDLVDVVDGVDQASSGELVAATLPAVCTRVSPTRANCPLANLGAGDDVSLGSFAARTSKNTSALVMRLDVFVEAKERANDHGDPNDPNIDTFTKGEPTSLEPLSDLSASMAYAGGSTVLDTTPGDSQHTKFFVNVPSSFSGFVLTTLEEFDPGETGYSCPTGFACFGQTVRTSAPGLFSAGNPAEVLATVLLSALEKGVTEKSLIVHHDPDDGPPIQFTSKCSGEIGTPPPAAELPCRRVVFDKKAGVAIIDAFDTNQGEWGWS